MDTSPAKYVFLNIPQTTKDLAGWHVCLDVIKSLLDGEPIDSREEDWEKAHSKYETAIKELV